MFEKYSERAKEKERRETERDRVIERYFENCVFVCEEKRERKKRERYSKVRTYF